MDLTLIPTSLRGAWRRGNPPSSIQYYAHVVNSVWFIVEGRLPRRAEALLAMTLQDYSVAKITSNSGYITLTKDAKSHEQTIDNQHTNS